MAKPNLLFLGGLDKGESATQVLLCSTTKDFSTILMI